MTCWSNHRVEPTATAAPLGGAIKATRSVARAVAVAHPGRSTELRGVTSEASSS